MEAQENKENLMTYDIDENIKIVYVLIRNEVKYNKKSRQNDEYTTVIRVFETEDSAQKYKIEKEKNNINKKIQYIIIPTPFGDL